MVVRDRARRGIELIPLLLRSDCRCDRIDDHGRHLELRGAILDVMTLRDPIEIGPDRPDVAVIVLRQEQADGPIEAPRSDWR